MKSNPHNLILILAFRAFQELDPPASPVVSTSSFPVPSTTYVLITFLTFWPLPMPPYYFRVTHLLSRLFYLVENFSGSLQQLLSFFGALIVPLHTLR